jgi:hypothetical protein
MDQADLLDCIRVEVSMLVHGHHPNGNNKRSKVRGFFAWEAGNCGGSERL